MSKSREGVVLMVGPGMDMPGGMTAVVRSYRNGGLFDEAGGVCYRSTYQGRALATQLAVMARAAAAIVTLRLGGRLKLLHAHSASRGSLWRKSLLCWLAQAMGVPYILHVHSGEFPSWLNTQRSWVRTWVRRTFERAQLVLCLAESWERTLKAIAPNARFAVLANPVEVPDRMAPFRQDARSILFMGRLRETKGVFDLLRAAKLAMPSHPDLKLVLAGDEGEHAVRELAMELGLSEAVVLPGWVEGEAKWQLMATADVFVLPSYFEGMPVGLLEAMAHGVPVLATEVGGIPDLVSSGVDGLLVPPGQPEALGAALRALMSSPEMRLRFREAAREKVVAEHATPVVVAQLQRIYALGGSRPKGEK